MPMLFEERLEELEYTEKKVKDIVDRVTAIATTKHAMVFTKLGEQYLKIEEEMDALKSAKDNLNADLKERIASLFNAEDEVLTRVIETGKVILTLSKETMGDTKTSINAEKVLLELSQSLTPELLEVLKTLEKKYTTVKAGEKSIAKLSVKTNEAVEPNHPANTLTNLAHKVLSSIVLWGHRYDMKLAKLGVSTAK